MEAFKKPREKLVVVQFRGNKHELVVSEQCQVQHIINEILVWINKFSFISRRMKVV